MNGLAPVWDEIIVRHHIQYEKQTLYVEQDGKMVKDTSYKEAERLSEITRFNILSEILKWEPGDIKLVDAVGELRKLQTDVQFLIMGTSSTIQARAMSFCEPVSLNQYLTAGDINVLEKDLDVYMKLSIIISCEIEYMTELMDRGDKTRNLFNMGKELK